MPKKSNKKYEAVKTPDLSHLSADTAPITPTPDLSAVGSTAGGQNSLVGEQISINLKYGPFYGVGDIQLTPTNYWATVSPGMSDKYYTIIGRGLQLGSIVRGKVYIKPVDQDEGVMNNWKVLIRQHGRGELTLKALRALIQKGNEGGWSLREILVACLKSERETTHRPEVMKLLEKAMDYVDPRYKDPVVVEEAEGKVTVTRRADGSVTISREDDDPNATKDYTPAPPQGYIPGNQNAKSVLDELLN